MFYESNTEQVTFRVRPRRQRPARLSFTYNAGEVTLDENSPKAKLCCAKARSFRVYHQDTERLLPRGICCVRCDTEYLDREEYPEGDYEGEGVEVHCVDLTTDFESSTDTEPNIYNVNTESFIFYRRVHPLVELPPCTSLLTMVNPNRRLINHCDPDEIEELRPGTHVMWHRPYTLWHHQLIRRNRGNGKCDVIHFDVGRTGSGGKAEVLTMNDYDFTSQGNGTAYEIVYDESIEDANPLELVMDRAISQLTEMNYCAFTNNCEHMVTFCKTGTRQSLQINWLGLKFLLLLVRILVLSTVIATVTKLNYRSKERINELEEDGELLFVLGIELIVFAVISLYWWRLYRRRQVAFTDCWRRILEALFELVLTMLAYMVHVLIFINIHREEGKADLYLAAHLISGVGLGMFGKIAGCVIGQAIVQCFLTPGDEHGVPSPRYGQYGRVGYAALVNV